MYLKVEVSKADGSNLDSASKVTFTNYPIASLFTQVDVILGGKLISSAANTYAHRSILRSFSTRRSFPREATFFFCLKTNWRRVGVKRQKKILFRAENSAQWKIALKATSHLTIFMHGLRAKSKIQRNNYHYGNGGPSLTGKTSSVSLIFTHETHRNDKYR